VPPRADLRRSQELFRELVGAPEGVERGLGSERFSGGSGFDVAGLVRGDDRLGPVERLDIYADMYFYRLRDSLAEDFPAVTAVAGSAEFHNLITDYLLAHPPSSWTLRDLGQSLPGFLDRHEIRGELPFLADLARLEWARIDVFDEADATPLTRPDLTGLAPREIEALTLGLIPAARLLMLDWSVAPIWRQVDDREAGGEPGSSHSAAVDGESCSHSREPLAVEPPTNRRTYLRVWRQGFRV
jgi:hypothetical protein